MSLQVRLVNNVRTTGFSRGGSGSDDRWGPEGFEWPDEKPPFVSSGVLVSPSGEAWVHRSVSAGDETVYDVYVVRKDEVDLFWLERYRPANQ